MLWVLYVIVFFDERLKELPVRVKHTGTQKQFYPRRQNLQLKRFHYSGKNPTYALAEICFLPRVCGAIWTQDASASLQQKKSRNAQT